MATILTRPLPVELKPNLAVGGQLVDTYRPGVLVRITRHSTQVFIVELMQNVNAFTEQAVGERTHIWQDQLGNAWVLDHTENGRVVADGRRASLQDALACAVTSTYLRGQRAGLW